MPATRIMPFSAPVKGWNTRDPIENMKPGYAITLENFFPQGRECVLRPDATLSSTGAAGAVLTLAEHVSTSGVRTQVIAAGGSIYVPGVGTALTSKGSGFSENRWQWTNFGGKLILVNGTDQPQQFDGTTLSATYYDTISSDNALISVSSYRERLYFVEKDTAKIWYPDVKAVGSTNAGTPTALTEYNVSYLLKRGGTLIYAGAYSRAIGSTFSDLFLAISTTGEVLVFTGANPGDDTTWSLVSRFYLSAPLSRRMAAPAGADLILGCKEGLIQLSAVLSTSGQPDDYSFISDVINPTWGEAVSLYGGNANWEIAHCPESDKLIVNVPIVSNGTQQQFVMNTLTGAWCLYTGINATTWGSLNGSLYYGTADGEVWNAEGGFSENSHYIDARMQTAYQAGRSADQIKAFTLGKAHVHHAGTLNFLMDVSTDYRTDAIQGTAVAEGDGPTAWGSPWGSAWGVGEADQYNDDWRCVSGIGRAASVELKGRFKNARCTVSAFTIMYEQSEGVF